MVDCSSKELREMLRNSTGHFKSIKRDERNSTGGKMLYLFIKGLTIELKRREKEVGDTRNNASYGN